MKMNLAGLRQFKTMARLSFTGVGFAAVASSLFFNAWVGKGFFADGSFFFVQVLNSDSFLPVANDAKHNRFFSNAVNQFPLIIARQFGVTDGDLLRLLFNLGLLLGPFFLLLLLVFKVKNEPDSLLSTFALSSYLFATIPSNIFSLNQSLVASVLIWYQIHFLTSSRRMSRADWILLVVINIYLFSAHESTLIWAPIVGLYALLKILTTRRRYAASPDFRDIFILISSSAQFLFGVFWQVSHPVSEATEGFLALLPLLSPATLGHGLNSFGFLLVCFLVVLLLASAIKAKLIWVARLIPILTIGGMMGIVLSGSNQIVALYSGQTEINPGLEFSMRILAPFGTAFLIALFLFFYSVKSVVGLQIESLRHSVGLAISVSFIFASLWLIREGTEWKNFQTEVSRSIEVTRSQIITQDQLGRNFEEAGSTNQLYKYSWGWTWPAYSIALQYPNDIKTLIEPADHLENFNVGNEKQGTLEIPFMAVTDLERLHLNSEYQLSTK